jgi:hypothetical protein
VVDIKFLIGLLANGYHTVAVLRDQHSYHNLKISCNCVDFCQIVKQSLVWLEMLRSISLLINQLFFMRVNLKVPHLFSEVSLNVLIQTIHVFLSF